MTDLRDVLERIATRGAPRGAHSVLSAAQRQAIQPPVRRHVIIPAIAIAAAVAMIAGVTVHQLRDGRHPDQIRTTPSEPDTANTIRCRFDHRDDHAELQIDSVLGARAVTTLGASYNATAEIIKSPAELHVVGLGVRTSIAATDGSGVTTATGGLGPPRLDPNGLLSATGADAVHINCAWAHRDTTLAAALTANHVDAARDPALALRNEQFCGTTTTTNAEADSDPTTVSARRCFLDAVLQHRTVTLLQRYRTAVDQPPNRIEIVRSNPDGHFDSIATDPGTQTSKITRCGGIVANELLNASPEPPYNPGFFEIYSCAETDATAALPPISDTTPPPPEWFTTRTQLPSCGTATWQPVDNALYIDRRLSTGATHCISDAIARKQPVEIGYGRTDQPNSPARWLRVDPDHTTHIIDAPDPADTKPAWHEYQCPNPPITPDGTPPRQNLPTTCTLLR